MEAWAQTELVPHEDVRNILSDERYMPVALEGSIRASAHTGPVATVTLENTVQLQAGVWEIPSSDRFLHIVAAEITDSAKTTLTTALGDSAFAKQSAGESVLDTNGPLHGIGPTYLMHLFQRNVWVSECKQMLGD